VVYARDGALVYKAHVTTEEACFSLSEYAKFVRDYPDLTSILAPRTIEVDNVVLIDFMFMNSPVLLGHKAWDALYAKKCRSHLSPNISESVTNWVFWYRERDPEITLVEGDAGVAESLTVRDPAGQPIRFTLAKK
jgi:hypothetical protein